VVEAEIGSSRPIDDRRSYCDSGGRTLGTAWIFAGRRVANLLEAAVGTILSTCSRTGASAADDRGIEGMEGPLEFGMQPPRQKHATVAGRIARR